jgi:adenosylmethionine-8-amino-7-oxononanoate aminotransferase
MVAQDTKTRAMAPADMDVIAREHVWAHSLPWVEVAENDGMKVFAEGKGSTLWDIHGKEYLDGISGLWVVNAGHGRAEIGEAMAEQAKKLAYVSAEAYTTEPTVHLAHKLAEITPGDLSRIYFCSGGSEAVETALKIAKQVQAMRGFPRRYKIIARRGSYHGMTHGAMSLTAMRNEAYFGPFMYGVSHVPSPNKYRSDFGLEGEAHDIMAAKYVEQEIENQGPETVAAVIGEPISSSAGVHVPTPIYWQMLRDICDRHGVLLIADEVINGFGSDRHHVRRRAVRHRAGHHDGRQGTDLRLRADGGRHRAPGVFDVFTKQEMIGMGHLLTFGGHPVAAAAALANLKIYEEENLVERGAEMGVYLRDRMTELLSHPVAAEVRGVGMLKRFRSRR